MKAIYRSVKAEVDHIIFTARKNGRTVERIELETWEWDEFYNDVGRGIWAGLAVATPGRGLYMGVEITCNSPNGILTW